MVKNMCFLLRGYRFKSRGGRVCILRRLYQSNRWAEGVPCPTNKEVSYTNLMCWLDRDLKNRLLLLLLLFNNTPLTSWINWIWFCFNVLSPITFDKHLKSNIFFLLNNILYFSENIEFEILKYIPKWAWLRICVSS